MLTSWGRVCALAGTPRALMTAAVATQPRRSPDGPAASVRWSTAGCRRGDSTRSLAASDSEADDEADDFVRWSTAKHLHVTDGFLGSGLAGDLRTGFEDRVGNPRHTRGSRFVWDYWHVEDQYTLIRTPEESYKVLEEKLLAYAQDKLGCRSLSPIWLSYYVDGCHQGLHADNPHGPWAFVLSLTEWDDREFRGGETMILQKHILDYWRGFQPSQGTELGSIVDLIEAKFDRLTVFDPRFPHGVRQVQGTRDPLKARIVLHGWFSDPSPFFTGGLTEEEATPILSSLLDELFKELSAEVGNATGTLSIRLQISGESGDVTAVESLTDTLIAIPGQGYETPEDVRDEIQDCVRQFMLAAKFPPSSTGEDSQITIPLVFE